MDQKRAENRAKALNSMVKGKTAYMAHPMEKTKWEKGRWGVVQTYGDAPYPKNVVGIAMA
jgi:hypothetical protein